MSATFIFVEKQEKYFPDTHSYLDLWSELQYSPVSIQKAYNIGINPYMYITVIYWKQAHIIYYSSLGQYSPATVQ